MSAIEYLMRVRHEDGEFTATIRQFAPSGHPEDRAMAGPETTGQGANAEAAMVSAIASAHFGTVNMPRRGGYAC